MVTDGSVIDPGLTCDEALALFGWTIGLAVMTGGAFAVGIYPGGREHAHPLPTPSSAPDPTSRQVIAASSGGTRPSSGARPPDFERKDLLAAAGQHTSCLWQHGRAGSPSQQGSGICRLASSRRNSRDSLVPPWNHPRACNHEAVRERDPSDAAFHRALEFLRDVFGECLSQRTA